MPARTTIAVTALALWACAALTGCSGGRAPAKAPTSSSTAVVTPRRRPDVHGVGPGRRVAAAIRKALAKAQLTTAQVKLVRQKEPPPRAAASRRADVHRLRLYQGRPIRLRPSRPAPVLLAEQGLGLAGPQQGAGQGGERGRRLPAGRCCGRAEVVLERSEGLPEDEVQQGRDRQGQGDEGSGRPAQGRGRPQPAHHLQERRHTTGYIVAIPAGNVLGLLYVEGVSSDPKAVVATRT